MTGARTGARTVSRALTIFAASVVALNAAVVPADSTRGAQLFETLSCIQCHSINGKGGTIAPDLGRRVDRNFTPASLAATMWNHAPAMWLAMRERKVQPGDLNEQAAADLLAYFYSAHFFDQPGDAGRGKRLFSIKHCAVCHGLTDAKIPEAKPVARWESTGQPIELINAMWNHVSTMRQEFAAKKLDWPGLTTHDLTDILVYVRNLPSTSNESTHVRITSGADGQALFQSKGCIGCHKGKLELPPRLKGRTLNDIAVDMWNHEPKMTPKPAQLSSDEMRELISYLWAGQFFRDEGNASSGERLFKSKHCAACHQDASSGAPRLEAKSFTAAAMVSALWHHGPGMLDLMKTRNIAWPRFEGHQMSDLLAFLNSGSNSSNKGKP